MGIRGMMRSTAKPSRTGGLNVVMTGKSDPCALPIRVLSRRIADGPGQVWWLLLPNAVEFRGRLFVEQKVRGPKELASLSYQGDVMVAAPVTVPQKQLPT
jgi:hypothetical protein